MVVAELRALRTEMGERFTQVDERLDRSEAEMKEFRAEMEARFVDVHRAIDRLGARWGK